MHNDEPVILTDPDAIELFSWVALRGSLSLEIKGMTRRGQSARTIAQQRLKLPGRPSKTTVYAALNKHIVSLGGTDRPL